MKKTKLDYRDGAVDLKGVLLSDEIFGASG
jgi:hypothetical protein